VKGNPNPRSVLVPISVWLILYQETKWNFSLFNCSTHPSICI
jgi:hypothetical protein